MADKNYVVFKSHWLPITMIQTGLTMLSYELNKKFLEYFPLCSSMHGRSEIPLSVRGEVFSQTPRKHEASPEVFLETQDKFSLSVHCIRHEKRSFSQ